MTDSQQTRIESKKDFRFRSEFRVKNTEDFAHIYDLKQRAGDDHLLVFSGKNEFDHPRLGLSVSKKHGNSVRRSRLKRMLREAFRLSQHELPRGWDFILIPRYNDSSTVLDYQKSLIVLARKLVRRQQQP